MYKLYFTTVKNWLQKVISPRAVCQYRLSQNVFEDNVFLCEFDVILKIVFS